MELDVSRSMRIVIRLLLMAGAGLWCLWGCSVSSVVTVPEINADALENAEQSTAAVLVPLDERFRPTWDFHVLDSPDNYTYSANAASWDDALPDRRLLAYGYLVNDVDFWNGGYVLGYVEVMNDLHRSALADSADPESSDDCDWLDADLQIVICEYERDEYPRTYKAVFRRFDDVDTVMTAAMTNDASIEYLFGEFEVVPIEEAREKWLVNARFPERRGIGS